MKKHHEIEADPYAHKKADRLFAIYRRVFKSLLLEIPDSIRSACEAGILATFDEVAQKTNNRFVDYLCSLRGPPFRVQIDHGAAPLKFITAQIEHPRLRDFYEERRIADALRNAFCAACKDCHDHST